MKLIYLIDFVLFYMLDVLSGALRVALDVITPHQMASPGVVKFPIEVESDLEIALLSNLITFSPGSMVIDIDPDRSHLYIHVMFLGDPDKWKENFKKNFEARVLRILR